MTRRELVERFDLARVNPSPAVFDAEKLEWLNGEHLRTLDPARFAAAALDHLRHSGSPLADQPARVAEVAPLVQEKLRLLSQFEGLTGFLFGPVQMRPEAWQKVAADTGASAASLAAARDALAGLRDWRAAEIEAALRAACERTGLKPRVLYAPVRVAISGSSVSPGLYESLELLGRESSLERIESAIVRLS
jgi:glutamyl-tRNA synthetase